MPDTLLNSVSLDTLQSESFDNKVVLSDGSYPPSLLNQLQRWDSWLKADFAKPDHSSQSSPSQPSPTNFPARYAASAWARGECELFGVSLPRFHGRVYLSDQHTSFLDIRRLRLLTENAVAWYDKKVDDKQVPGGKTLQDTLTTGAYASAIAGGFLERPARLANFHLIEADLGLAFGENQFWGTPYLKHMRLGGGMCSQVCVMMAALLMWRNAVRIGGVADITMKARENHTRAPTDSLKIDGLNQPEILMSLPEGLGGWVETGSPREEPTSSSEVDPSRTTLPGRLGRIKTALRSYALSNIPVILFVDLDKLAGVGYKSDTDILCTQQHELPTAFRNLIRANNRTGRRHAVILGGCDLACDRSESTTARDLVIHDPATVSHLCCSIEQLYEARTIYPNSKTPESLFFIPIVPAEVHISFGDRNTGLSLLDAVDDTDFARLDEAPPYVTSEYRLVNFQDDDEDSNHRPETVLRGTMSDASITQVCQWGRAERRGWCWVEVQYLKDGGVKNIVVWNAEQPDTDALNEIEKFSPTDAPPFNFMQRIPQTRRAIPAETQPAETLMPAVAPAALPEGRKLTPALISSFCCVGSFADCANEYRRLPFPVEVDLYCFMHHALKHFFDEKVAIVPAYLSLWSTYGKRVNEFTHPTDFLEFLDPNDVDARQREPIRKLLVQEIIDAFDGLSIVALSSYFPQITNHRPGDRNAAKSALVTVGWIASRLIQAGHPIGSIEVVAGTRVEGISPKLIDPEPPGHVYSDQDAVYFEATMISREVGLERFAAEMAEVLSSISGFWPTNCNKPRISLEFEPGSMYLAEASQLKSASSGPVLSMLAELSDKTGWSVQVNLDTAHAQLGQLSEGDISALIGSVSHIHYAHTWPKSHTSDVRASCFSLSKEYADNALVKFVDPAAPKAYDGAVSAELEVIRTREWLHQGVEQFVNSLLNISNRK